MQTRGKGNTIKSSGPPLDLTGLSRLFEQNLKEPKQIRTKIKIPFNRASIHGLYTDKLNAELFTE